MADGTSQEKLVTVFGNLVDEPDELVLRPGQTIRHWGRTDRVTDQGIQYGVDGPIGFPLRLVIEDGELRLRTDASSSPQTPTEDDRYEDQPVTDADGTVIGHIWELERRFLLEHPREWVAAVDDNHENRPRFSSRDGAEAWVRANAPRDGRPLTVPYDAEKVLGLKGAVVGWVWLDPEHAGDDGRWLAVHGAHPEHQHPLFGSKGPGLDARNQAIGWVLEQDKEARS